MTDTSHPRAPGTQPEETLGALFATASRDLSALVRSEIELAKAEIQVDVKNGATGGAMFGAAAFLGVLASILLLIALALFLVWLGLEAWLAFLIVDRGPPPGRRRPRAGRQEGGVEGRARRSARIRTSKDTARSSRARQH